MPLQQKIDQDLKSAMTSKNALKTSVLRFLKSALKYSAIEKKTDTLGDADILQVLQKQIKQRRESIDQFAKAGRKDLADKETQELQVLETYLPKQISDAELSDAVKKALQETGASSKKDFGRAMKHLTEKLSGGADARRISEALGKVLV